MGAFPLPALRRLTLGVSLALWMAAPLYAQFKPANCERDAESRLREMAGALAFAGEVTYKKLFDRALLCVHSGTCSKAEGLVRVSELMVDEQVIAIQRKKLEVIKQFISTAGPKADACTVAALLPTVVEQMDKLNAQQLARFDELLSRYGTDSKGESNSGAKP